MKKTATFLSSILLLALSFSASAFEVDFNARINNASTQSDNIRVISNANFINTDIQTDGSFTVAFSVSNSNGETIYNGSSVITSTETEVIIGKARTGRIVMRHDIQTGEIKTRFVIRPTYDIDETPNHTYSISATSGTWSGQSTIVSTVSVDTDPQEFTITGTPTRDDGISFFIDYVTVEINGTEVYSDYPAGADEDGFSIPVTASESSNTYEITLRLNGEWDGGSFENSVTRFVFPGTNLVEFGDIEISFSQPDIH